MDPASLEARLALLERRSSRLRWLTLLAVGLAAATPAWLMLRPDRDLAEGRLWLARDASGRIRAMLGVTADGVGLTMYDSTGQMRLDAGLAPGGVPGLLLLSPRGEPAVTLNLQQDGTPVLRLSDFGRRLRLEVKPGDGGQSVPFSPPPPDTLMARRPGS